MSDSVYHDKWLLAKNVHAANMTFRSYAQTLTLVSELVGSVILNLCHRAFDLRSPPFETQYLLEITLESRLWGVSGLDDIQNYT